MKRKKKKGMTVTGLNQNNHYAIGIISLSEGKLLTYICLVNSKVYWRNNHYATGIVSLSEGKLLTYIYAVNSKVYWRNNHYATSIVS